jgi:hypothetical protein
MRIRYPTTSHQVYFPRPKDAAHQQELGAASSSHLWRKWSLEATALMWYPGEWPTPPLINHDRRRDIPLPDRGDNRLQA